MITPAYYIQVKEEDNMAITETQQKDIAKRLEGILVTLRHRGVKNLAVDAELVRIIDELKEE